MKGDGIPMKKDNKDNLSVEQCQTWWEKAVKKGYFNNWTKPCLTQPQLYAKIPLNNNSHILEIGCGEGRQLLPFLEISKSVYGIDISKSAIELSKKKCPNAILKSFNGRDIPFKNDAFDFVTSVYVFQHVSKDNAKQLLKETCRLLKKGGYALHQFLGGINAQGKDYNHYSGLKGFDHIMYNNGYTTEEIKEVYKESNLDISWIEIINTEKTHKKSINIWVCCKKK